MLMLADGLLLQVTHWRGRNNSYNPTSEWPELSLSALQICIELHSLIDTNHRNTPEFLRQDLSIIPWDMNKNVALSRNSKDS